MGKRTKRNQYADDTAEAATPIAPSRSEAKRHAKAVVPLAAQLVTLTPHQLQALDLDPDLHEEIVDCKRLTRAARQRQLKHIAGRLRQGDWQAIQRALSK